MANQETKKVRAYTVSFAMYPAEKNTAEKLAGDAGSKDVEIACQCDHPACH